MTKEMFRAGLDGVLGHCGNWYPLHKLITNIIPPLGKYLNTGKRLICSELVGKFLHCAGVPGGKVVDIYTEYHADEIVRYQGNNRRRHTGAGDEKVVLHLIPSGVLHAGKRCVIGNGVVLDPEVFIMEVNRLKAAGRLEDDSTLLLSESLHIIMPNNNN